jgi:Lrp/AsnC family transcriptional regulator for asnA, asnC and gidA
MPKANLDHTDRAIIAALARDGRMSFRNIARQLDISEGTVRTRMTRLQDENLIRVTLVGSPVALGGGVSAMVLLRVKPGHVRETAEILGNLKNVRFVGLSFGPADIILQSLHKDVGDLHRFVSELIPEVAPAVTSTDTFQIADVTKSSWTWGDWFEHLDTDQADALHAADLGAS